ncbi:hypothetical protein IQ264_13335 [Phormidium sp. LEGE 05292]|uniref:hypothetical protein n=1 Tax=[Phormidium] sp. LEGE 05292 TaxID=767427 RepID=UPI00187E1D47|nr:hypothetical protein [Phormidium sp. LEGE 05292]MBE9226406.1 hypothetical protein [Phormidium sp. LEGE 05292]
MLTTSHQDRFVRARCSLAGLSVGDAFGVYTGVEGIPKAWIQQTEPLPKWPFLERDTFS